jgi:galactokinase
MEEKGIAATRRRVVEEFRRRWEAEPPLVVRAPGRVNLIGEHTDYNDGFVLPMAIDRAVWIALRPRSDGQVLVHSLDFGDSTAFALPRFGKGGPAWGEYLKGVAWSLSEAGHTLSGWEGVVGGDIPIGAGLSSSAAIEVATARAFAQASQLAWEPATMARITQRAENEWVGVRCGIMDQLTSIAGVADHALLIDCRSLSVSPVPLPAEAAIVILDTGTRRAVATSAYDERRRQCQQAAEFFGAPALRDVTPQTLDRARQRLPEATWRRARHVVSENERTLRAAEALRRGDVIETGRLMSASHESLKSDFEVSSRELDAIVGCSLRHQGCHGARLTGAGFGGCAVALVRHRDLGDFAGEVPACYHAANGLEARLLFCGASEGATVSGQW